MCYIAKTSRTSIIHDMMKQNWFETLNAALESEGLLESWELHFQPIGRDQNFSYTWQDGSRYGHWVSIYRAENGRYERPVHYKR